MMYQTPKLAAITLLAFSLSACASFPLTESLDKYDDKTGYRYANLDNSQNKEDLFVILTFSGGGTRAAALSYGVLEKLRETWVPIDGERRNLLQEVDVISSVSGGSFTASYYGLHGDEIFQQDGRFQKNFLYKDVEAILKGKLFNPYNWMRLLSPTFGRIEIAEEVYQDLLFDQATFHDLEERKRKPFLLINATDMAKGAQFTFIQSQFDPMCADLASVPISRAVAASSNFPVAFSPLTLNSYPGSCEYREPEWVENALKDVGSNPRRYYRARHLRTYQEPQRNYVHLLDGGVSDNIGLRGPLTAMRSGDVAWSVLNKINLEEIKKLVVIVVDAKNVVPPKFDVKATAPGLFSVVETISTTPLDNYSFDTVELLKDTMRRRADAQRMEPDLHQVELYRIYVGFDQIEDDQERMKFLSMETRFSLSTEQVDSLRKIGGVLLEKSQCFKSLIGTSDKFDSNTCIY